MAKKWIQGMNLKKGALHKSLGVPMDKKIPVSMLAEKKHEIMEKKKGGKKLSPAMSTMLKRINLAGTFRSFGK